MSDLGTAPMSCLGQTGCTGTGLAPAARSKRGQELLQQGLPQHRHPACFPPLKGQFFTCKPSSSSTWPVELNTPQLAASVRLAATVFISDSSPTQKPICVTWRQTNKVFGGVNAASCPLLNSTHRQASLIHHRHMTTPFMNGLVLCCSLAHLPQMYFSPYFLSAARGKKNGVETTIIWYLEKSLP